MFELDKNQAVASDYPLIADEYKVLHFDDDPILFSGTNKYGNRIIGSLVDHDDDNRMTRFFTWSLIPEPFLILSIKR